MRQGVCVCHRASVCLRAFASATGLLYVSGRSCLPHSFCACFVFAVCACISLVKGQGASQSRGIWGIEMGLTKTLPCHVQTGHLKCTSVGVYPSARICTCTSMGTHRPNAFGCTCLHAQRCIKVRHVPHVTRITCDTHRMYLDSRADGVVSGVLAWQHTLHMHAQTQQICLRMCTCMYKHTLVRAHAHIPQHSTRTHACTSTCTHMHGHAHAHTHTHTCTHTRTCTCTHTHAHARAHTCRGHQPGAHPARACARV